MVRLDIIRRQPFSTRPAEFRLKVEQATIAQFPQRCTPGAQATTPLGTSFTLDDGVHPEIVVIGQAAWECEGSNPQMPSTLKVQQLLPVP